MPGAFKLFLLHCESCGWHVPWQGIPVLTLELKTSMFPILLFPIFPQPGEKFGFSQEETGRRTRLNGTGCFGWWQGGWCIQYQHTTVWGEILLFGHAQNSFMALNFQFMPGVGSLLEEDLRNSSIWECSSSGGGFEHGSFMVALECLDLWFPVEFRLGVPSSLLSA